MPLEPDWYEQIYALLDLRSFSNLWYWLSLAVVWSSSSHFVMGVPYDMVLRARRSGGEAARDLDDLARIQARRILSAIDRAGVWLAGMAAFWLTFLGLLGFWHRIEFAQAVFLIVLPLMPVAWLTIRAARRVAAEGLTGEALWRRIGRTRRAIQAIGFAALFVTAVWGMYQNLLLRGLHG